MDYTGQRVNRVVIPDPLEVDTLVANHVEAGTANIDQDLTVEGDIEAKQNVNVWGEVFAGGVSVNYLGGGYQLPVVDGTPGQVLTTDGANTAQWADAAPTESKGDLLFFMTEPTIIETTILQWFDLAGEPPTSNLGSLTIPANSMQVGDIYTLQLTGELAVSTTANLEVEFKIEVNGDLIAFTGTAPPITVARHTGTQTDPVVPFRMEVQFVVRTDPTAFPLQPDNVHCIPQFFYRTSANDSTGPSDNFGSFLEVYPFPPNLPYTTDNTAPVELAVYGRILGGGIAGIRVQNYTLTKQFVGYESSGSFTNQSLNTTDDVTFNSVTVRDRYDLDAPTGQQNFINWKENGVQKWEMGRLAGSHNLYLQDKDGNTIFNVTQGGGVGDPGGLELLATLSCDKTLNINSGDAGDIRFTNAVTKWYFAHRTIDDSLRFDNESFSTVLALKQNGLVTIGSGLNSYSLPTSRGNTGQYLKSDGVTSSWATLPQTYTGGVHQFSNATNTTFTLPNQWETVVGDSFVGGLLVGFTLAGTATQPALQYDGENGRYLKLFVSVAWQDGGGAGNAEYVLSIHRNGNLLFDTWISSQLDATATYPRAASTGCVVLANTGDVFEVKIRNNTNTNAALVKDMTFSAHTI